MKQKHSSKKHPHCRNCGAFTRVNGMYKNFPQRAGPYLRITAGPQAGQYVHIMVGEAKIGRKLKPGETFEHEDGDTLNNDPGNLVLATRSEHAHLTRKRLAAEAESDAPAPF